MNEIKIGVIGYGLMGRVHAEIYDSLPGVRVCAIADVSPIPSGNGMKSPALYEDYEEMLRAHPLDAVSICTPENVRVGPVRAACSQGVDILLEKPISSSIEDAVRIVDAVDGGNVLFMVGHNLRFMDTYRTAKQALSEETFGELRQIVSTRVVSSSSATRIGRRCSLPVFLGVHDYDLVSWLAGADPEYIGAVGDGKPVTEIEHSAAFVRFVNGVTAYINVNWAGAPGKASEYSLELHGTTGTYVVRDKLQKSQEGLPRQLYSSVRGEIEHFVKCVRERGVPAVGLADGLRALRMAIEIEQLSARNTAWFRP